MYFNDKSFSLNFKSQKRSAMDQRALCLLKGIMKCSDSQFGHFCDVLINHSQDIRHILAEESPDSPKPAHKGMYILS